ncbi:MAG: GGDEF domain-containing protein [Kineosporiaceae bacterium]|nr:GGDEF domain-containing protein [Kineosporiaceae bacterium]
MNSAPARRSGIEVAPLSQRTAAMAFFRLAAVVVLGVLGGLQTDLTAGDAWVVGGYVISTGLLSAVVWTRFTTLAVKAFGVSLLLDGVFVQYAHDRLGHGLATDTVVAAFLVAVCLLASFRTGLKLAVWQSLMLVIAWRGEESGLFPRVPGTPGISREILVVTDTLVLWLVVIVTSVAASINERELRRRRYDAESLERLASALLTDETPGAVTERLRHFVVDELGASRAVVRHRLAQDDTASAYLDLAATRPGATLALRLDPRLDPDLAAELPGARRLAAIPLRGSSEGRQQFLVLDFGPSRWRSHRVERRVIEAATQAAATAALALARAQLMEQAQRAAVTDGLTGVANRRAFDTALAEHERAWRERATPFVLVLVDVDFFKKVNDVHGHPVGDQVLAAVARVLTEQAGARAFVARYGGEEFAMIMPGMDTAAAAVLADRVRLGLPLADSPVKVTASMGVAGVPEDADGIEAVIRAADDALLLAKRTGRNRVVIAGPDTQTALQAHLAAEAQSPAAQDSSGR